MKKIIYPLLLIVFLCVTSACRKALKNEDDYFVKLDLVSVTAQSDGSVLVQATIESPGKAKGSVAENPGFCAGTSAQPGMLEHQLLATTDGSSFSAVFPAGTFSGDSVYYFRAFATNDYGFSYSNAVRMNAPSVTAPCTLTDNTVSLGAGTSTTYTYSSITAPDSYNSFYGHTFGGTATYQFGSAINTGIYHTTTSTSPAAGEVNVSLAFGAYYNGKLNSGSNVYVKKLGTNTFDIRICSAPWMKGSTTYYFDTRFVTPY